MLARPHRLSRPQDIIRVQRAGRVERTVALMLKTLPNGGRGRRFAVIVSTRVSKRATERNLLKRQIRAIIAKHLSLFPEYVDVVVTVRPGTPLPRWGELQHQLVALFRLSSSPKQRR